MSTIIGFTGKLGSGKDTAADRLTKTLLEAGAQVARGSFARKLKQSAAAVFPDVTMADWEVWKNDPNVKVLIVKEASGYSVEDEEFVDFPADVLSEQTVRGLLQRYGTEAHREFFGDNFWVEQAFSNIPDYDVLLFTDCRFENEALAIKDRGGVIVQVRGVNEETGTHASEAGFDPLLIDFEVLNTVRDDDFMNLDFELGLLAQKLFLPSYLTV